MKKLLVLLSMILVLALPIMAADFVFKVTDWTTIPFNPANCVAPYGGVWQCVNAPKVCQYKQIDDTMFIQIVNWGGSLHTPSTGLILKLPAEIATKLDDEYRVYGIALVQIQLDYPTILGNFACKFYLRGSDIQIYPPAGLFVDNVFPVGVYLLSMQFNYQLPVEE